MHSWGTIDVYDRRGGQSRCVQPSSHPRRGRGCWGERSGGLGFAYNNERVGKFADAELAALCDVANRSQYVHPIAIFLPGTEKDGWGHEGERCRDAWGV